MSALRELIGDAAVACPSVSIRGDVYLLGDAILSALAAAGHKIVPAADFFATEEIDRHGRPVPPPTEAQHD
jgi:hypothetical protein